ncbi:MAG: hypothetical protein KJ000_03370 [Pirellulaceae bacterium]|nr:hypothetical protein [Pirellulaceae bacterium]
MFNPPCRLADILTIAAWCCLATAASAEEPATDAPPATAEQLVQQLGDASFEQRERASRQLLEIGLEARAALDEGMRHPDAEIAFRCRRLWDEVRFLAGWRQVSLIVGDSPAARALYDKMFLADPALWYQLAENPGPIDGLFPERRTRLEQAVTQAQVPPAVLLEGTLANAFYFGLLAKQANPQQELERLDGLLRFGASRQALKDNQVLGDLWDLWAKATDMGTETMESDGPALDRLLGALQDKRPQARDIALNMLADERIPAGQRQYALLTLAKFKNPADDEVIQKWRNDSSPLDTLFSRGAVIKSQLGDVALAATIYRAGQDPGTLGFEYAKPDPNTLYSPSTLGFKNEEERAQAVKNWTDFATKQRGDESR